jgi:aminoglycoside phosphotransferase (APT) family kinase protein
VDDALRQWVEANADGRVVGEERPAVGGSRELYLVDVERHDGTVVPLVLRCEGGGSFSGTEISPAKEAVVYRALVGTAVPTPRVLALAPNGAAMLMERVPGSADLPPLRTDARTATMRSFADALAALHALDVESLDLPGFPRPRTAEDHARLDLELWARLASNGVPVLDPLLRYTGAWLWAHAPTTVARTVLVQGDTGPGNFLADDGVVTGLVDWEFAHLGDPMDDWAWVEMRADADEIPALHDQYTRTTGIPIDPDRIAYYRIAVDYRCAITTSLAVSRGGGARGWAPYLLQTERYLDGIATRLSARLGVDEPGEAVPSAASDRGAHFDALLEGIRSAVRHLDDVEVREQTRNLQILVRYLRAFDELGAEIEARDRADRAATFPDHVDDARLGELVEVAGRVGDEPTLRYLLRRRSRERLLWASLLDRPARG